MLRGGSRDGSSTDGARMMQIYAAPAAPAKYDRRMAATMATMESRALKAMVLALVEQRRPEEAECSEENPASSKAAL